MSGKPKRRKLIFKKQNQDPDSRASSQEEITHLEEKPVQIEPTLCKELRLEAPAASPAEREYAEFQAWLAREKSRLEFFKKTKSES